VRFWVKPETLAGESRLFAWRVDARGPALALDRKLSSAGGRLVLSWTGADGSWSRDFSADLLSGCWQQVTVNHDANAPEKSACYLNGRPLKAGSLRRGDAQAPGVGVVLGQGGTGYVDNLALHGRALNVNEIAFLADREQPAGFNRIYFNRLGGGGLRVWLNGTLIVPFVHPAESKVDVNWLYPFLKTGENWLSVELDPKSRPSDEVLEAQLRIHGQDLMTDGSLFPSAWRQTSADPIEAGSLIAVGNQAAKGNKTAFIESLKAKGLKPVIYKGMDWITPCYDRAWLTGQGPKLGWRPVEWSAGEAGVLKTTCSVGTKPHLMGFRFHLAEDGRVTLLRAAEVGASRAPSEKKGAGSR
jgi:hypothetical protein